MKSLISIIVPVYNTSKYLERCLNSLINQTYKNIEILIVNDGSTDNSLEICKNYQKKDKRVIILDKKNSGPSLTREYGFKHSKGEYLMFVDSDDWVDLDYCEYLLDLIKKANADVASCSYYINNSRINEEELLIELKKEEIIKNYLSYSYIKGCVWNKIYKKSIIKSKYFAGDLKTAEDILFTCNVIINSKKLICSTVPKYHYNVSNISITRSNVTKKNLDDKLYSHIEQIFLVNNFYPKDFEIQGKAIEKLYNELIETYNDIISDEDNNLDKYAKK